MGIFGSSTKAPSILETALNITGITKANPCVVSVTNLRRRGLVYITGVGGMTQVNGRYFSVIAASGSTITLGTGTALRLTPLGSQPTPPRHRGPNLYHRFAIPRPMTCA